MEEEGHAPVEVRSAADGTRRRSPGTGWRMGVRLRQRQQPTGHVWLEGGKILMRENDALTTN